MHRLRLGQSLARTIAVTALGDGSVPVADRNRCDATRTTIASSCCLGTLGVIAGGQQRGVATTSAGFGLSAVRRPGAGAVRTTAATMMSLTTTGKRQASSAVDEDEDEDLDELLMVDDATLALEREARAVKQAAAVDALVAELLPPGVTDAAKEALTTYFTQKPINYCIQADAVNITHVQDADGRDARAKGVGVLSVQEAIEFARSEGKDLVQFGGKDDKKAKQYVAFCRVRAQSTEALLSVKKYLSAEHQQLLDRHIEATGAPVPNGNNGAKESAKGEALPPLKDQVTVAFRDRVDAYFMGWKSKKLVQELRNRHPVRLVVSEFSGPVSAVRKMREMLLAIEKAAIADGVLASHHHTGVSPTAKELVVVLSPALHKPKEPTVKHPNEKDWERALLRLSELSGLPIRAEPAAVDAKRGGRGGKNGRGRGGR